MGEIHPQPINKIAIQASTASRETDTSNFLHVTVQVGVILTGYGVCGHNGGGGGGGGGDVQSEVEITVLCVEA